MKNLVTKFINYFPGTPDKMYIDERRLEVAEG